MKPRHILSLADVTVDELKSILRIAEELKADFKKGIRPKRLDGKVLGLIFEKMSLRTRVSFEAGMTHLGGGSMLLEEQHIGLGKRESVPDVSRVLSSMVDCIVFRAKKHTTVEEFAKYSTVPVINALTDKSHPCQALADMLTIKEEFGSLDDVKIAWICDSNNVAA
ncbi:MAG: ornithine carbamoyltransferase, partial [Thermoguttaceae bacterium]|nr:ornithine carbamoyltransferase [Thermoguttaceae bacterium]